ncbi:MAG TPA: hypothetical protein VGM88_18315 [Kofleriaceae bacterium]|jgi:alpha-tubulin suppressor-like RCC1 family protein
MRVVVGGIGFVIACHGASPAGPLRNHALAGGTNAACLLHDGSVTCWRTREDGNPLEHAGTIEGFDDAVQLAPNMQNSCVVRRDATVACWGMEWTAASLKPAPTARAVPIPALDHVTQVSAAKSHACALRASGEVDCWGETVRGAIDGNEPSSQVMRPKPIAGIADAVEVSCGDDHTCVRHRDNTVSCIGAMDDGVPITLHAMDGLRDVTALASGANFVCGITQAGTVLCAGANDRAQLGVGDRLPHPSAATVTGVDHVVQIAAADDHACARTQTGDVWCWGSEWQHGIMPDRGADERGPIKITGIGPATDLAVTGVQACVSVDGGAIWCWGNAPHDAKAQAVPVEHTL